MPEEIGRIAVKVCSIVLAPSKKPCGLQEEWGDETICSDTYPRMGDRIPMYSTKERMANAIPTPRALPKRGRPLRSSSN